MKMLCLLLMAASLQLAAKGYAQTISVSLRDASLEKLFKVIEQQTSYRFVYSEEALEKSKPVTIAVKNETLENVLRLSFSDEPLSYSIDEKFIVIKVVDGKTTKPVFSFDLKGMIVSEKNEPVAGASITDKGSGTATASDAKGDFVLFDVNLTDTITVSSIGYKTREISVNGRQNMVVHLEVYAANLDETIVIAYGKTTRRLSTADVSKINEEAIEKQPVSNPLAALEGRAPGLEITQANGLPGSAFKVQIRGQNSINAGNDPLFIIDGVPAAANNSPINQVGSALGSGGLSPFSFINPSDIESIEVLKDADATAIYGSRGANGVVIITTKKGRAGKIKTNINFWTGGSRVTRTMNFLDTKQYLALRREAFNNDNKPLTPSSAKDLLVWDTGRYTDYKKMLIGGTSHVSNLEASISGGSDQTQFLVGAGYHYESTVYPGDLGDKRASFHFNLNHADQARKFNLNLTANFSSDDNTIDVADLTAYINLPPNTPALFDSTGQLNWQKGGFNFTNPLAYLKQQYVAKTDDILGNLKLSYRFLNSLSAKINLGYNSIILSDYSLHPISSQNPAFGPLGYNDFGSSRFTNVIAEPQLEFQHAIGKSELTILTGATWQQNEKAGSEISGYGYNSDALLKSIAAAPTILSNSNSFSQYKYAAAFGRITWDLNDKYILNLNGRRDGSTKFGPDRQYSNFGSLAGAWLFNKEQLFKDNLSFLSHGKIRMSYGITGNDQIGDYEYLDTWTATVQGTPGLYPTALNNPAYEWEKNKKLELAFETALVHDRIFLSVAYYNNKSSNQLVSYSLPSQTGASSIIENFPATVQNKGVEIESVNQIFDRKNFSWTSSLNISIPKNRLLSFPDIETSSYNNLIIGQPLNLIAGYNVTGVDPATGVYNFRDVNGQVTSSPSDAEYNKNFGSADPKFFGGFENVFRSHGFEFDVFTEFRKQTGRNYLYDLGFNIPGTMVNEPTAVLQRWTKPGENAAIQKLTTGPGTPAYSAAIAIRGSGAQIIYGDASYIRVKTTSLSYQLPAKLVTKWKASYTKIYLLTENLFTFTRLKCSDPETQNLFRLPPLRTITAGIQITFNSEQ